MASLSSQSKSPAISSSSGSNVTRFPVPMPEIVPMGVGLLRANPCTPFLPNVTATDARLAASNLASMGAGCYQLPEICEKANESRFSCVRVWDGDCPSSGDTRNMLSANARA